MRLTFLTQKLDHLPGAEGRGPVEQRLPHVVGEVDVDGAAGDGGQQRVRVLAADAVDELSVRLVAARAARAAGAAARALAPRAPACAR